MPGSPGAPDDPLEVTMRYRFPLLFATTMLVLLLWVSHADPASAGGGDELKPCRAGETAVAVSSHNRSVVSGEANVAEVPAGTARINGYIVVRNSNTGKDPMTVFLCITTDPEPATKAVPEGSGGSSNTGPLVGIGAAAVVLGGAFVYGIRRPRSSSS